MSKMIKGFVAAFLAAVVVGIVISCGYALVLLFADVKDSKTEVGDGLLFIAISAGYVSAVIALLAIAFMALPHVIISNRLRRSSRTYYFSSGIVIGLLVVVIAAIRQSFSIGPAFQIGSDQYFFAFSAIVAGAVSALVFWSVARPDKWSNKTQ